MGRPLNPEKRAAAIATMRTFAADGGTASEIAHALNVSIQTIIRWAASEAIQLPTKSQARKKALADPEVRAKMSAASKKAWADPEVRAKMSAASKKAWADPEVRAKMSAASKKAWADPEVRARVKATRHGAKGVLIPKWVPLDLQDDYLDTAAEFGEERAASHVRRLKHEALRGCA